MFLLENIPLLIFSFTASVGFGVVFGIKPSSLLHAGVGGVLTRAVLLAMLQVTDKRLFYVMVAALAGAFYSDFIAKRHHTPLAKYLYPALVPVIPGDMLYNTVVCFVNADSQFFYYGRELMLALLGMAIGSMIAPMLANGPKYVKQVIKTKSGGRM